LASTSRVATVFLRQTPVQLLLEPRGPFRNGNGFVDLVIMTLGLLGRNALLDEFLHPAIFFYQLIMVFDHVFKNGLKFRAGKARQGALDKIKIVTAVNLVKNVHHCQAVAFNLRTPAEIDDAGRFCFHGDNPPAVIYLVVLSYQNRMFLGNSLVLSRDFDQLRLRRPKRGLGNARV
jgi:hypothetical protein